MCDIQMSLGVFTGCNDNCTGLLLDDIANFSSKLAEETAHVTNGFIPPPWEHLAYIDTNSTILFDEIEREIEIKQRLNELPWYDYENLFATIEALLKKVSKFFKAAIFLFKEI